MNFIRMLFGWAIRVFDLMLIIHCAASWVHLEPNPVTDFIAQVVEPVLSPLRRVLARYLPPLTRPVDWTPAVLILLLSLISTLF